MGIQTSSRRETTFTRRDRRSRSVDRDTLSEILDGGGSSEGPNGGVWSGEGSTQDTEETGDSSD